jgi:fructokinase
MNDAASMPVVCFGEFLWDALPHGLFPGGAPVNVAYHLAQLGVPAIPVTAVGQDFLGDEGLRHFRRCGLDTRFVARLPDKPTGAVRVDLDEKGSPSYEFLEDVAWDWIPVGPDLEAVAKESAGLVYGTLAQRSDHNLAQLERLMGASGEALKIYDVNLRSPYDSADLVWHLTAKADAIKLNEAELNRLLGGAPGNEDLHASAQAFAQKTGCEMICVTAGARGAGLLKDGNWFWSEGRPIRVKDTVGAGDSFLAALVEGLLRGEPRPQRMLDRACRLAEFVAGCDGASPRYRVSGDTGFEAVE